VDLGEGGGCGDRRLDPKCDGKNYEKDLLCGKPTSQYVHNIAWRNTAFHV